MDDSENNRYKKENKIDRIFLAPDANEFEKKISGYSFCVSDDYKSDKLKESVFNHKKNRNKIFVNVRDPVPIDYLDKMSDKQKDIKLQCE